MEANSEFNAAAALSLSQNALIGIFQVAFAA